MMNSNLDLWPSPLADAAYHGLSGELVRTIEPHSESDPVALLIQTLIAFGNVIGHGPHFTVEADRHALNLFSVLVGKTSKARKGLSWGRARQSFQAVDPNWLSVCVKSGLSTGEGLIWAVRDPGSASTLDPGALDKRLLMVEAEFASMLRVMGRDGNTLSPVIRQAWDSGNLRILTKNSPAQATDAHISIIGHITKDELLRYLERTETGNGFGNRFLWTCVQRSKCLPEGGQLEPAALAPLIERLRQVVEFARMVGELKWDEEGRALWAAGYPKLSEGGLGLLGALTSRAEAQVSRLACLYALLDLSYVVKAVHLQAALALWDYCKASVYCIFGDRIGDPVADRILRALRATPDGFDRTDIRDLFQRNRKEWEIDQALELIQKNGLAKPVIKKTGGRPEERWFVVDGATTKTT